MCGKVTTCRMSIKSFYRISDNFQLSSDGQNFNKARPDWFNKRDCFLNFISVFGKTDTTVIADSVCEDTYAWLCEQVGEDKVHRTSYKSGAFSFLHACRLCMELPDDTNVFMQEDDYAMTPDAKKVALEGLGIAHYVTLVDHPDKFVNAGTAVNGCVGNPFIEDNSEVTRVYLTESVHWKLTNSTMMSWGTKVKLIKEDYDAYAHFCQTGFPNDFHLFQYLINTRKRKLISPLPGKSCHLEKAYMTPLVQDWHDVIKESIA